MIIKYEEIKAYLEREKEIEILSAETIEATLDASIIEPTKYDSQILVVNLMPSNIISSDVLSPGSYTHHDFCYSHKQLTGAGIPRKAGKSRLGLRKRREMAARIFDSQIHPYRRKPFDYSKRMDLFKAPKGLKYLVK